MFNSYYKIFYISSILTKDKLITMIELLSFSILRFFLNPRSRSYDRLGYILGKTDLNIIYLIQYYYKLCNQKMVNSKILHKQNDGIQVKVEVNEGLYPYYGSVSKLCRLYFERIEQMRHFQLWDILYSGFILSHSISI